MDTKKIALGIVGLFVVLTAFGLMQFTGNGGSPRMSALAAVGDPIVTDPPIQKKISKTLDAFVQGIASGNNRGCTLRAADTFVYGVKYEQSVELCAPYDMQAPGWFDGAEANFYVVHRGKQYNKKVSTGDYLSGKMCITVTAKPDEISLYGVTISAWDGWWWSCFKTSAGIIDGIWDDKILFKS